MQNKAEVTYFMIRNFLKRGDKRGGTHVFGNDVRVHVRHVFVNAVREQGCS